MTTKECWADPARIRLRFVPLNQLVLHERVDPLRVERLVERLRRDKVLRNPPLVTKLVSQQYMVLDGATRVEALKALGCRDCVVQIVAYEEQGIRLGRWHHILVGVDAQAFFQQVERIEGLILEPGDVHQAERLLAARDIVCYFSLPDGRIIMARERGGKRSLDGCVKLLDQIVRLYEGRAHVLRTPGESLETLWAEPIKGATLAVVFPCFAPPEVMHLSLNGARLPMGITRHIVPGRVLGLNVSVDLLWADTPLDEKNAWLDNMIRTRLQEKKVRLYQEPVFIFDE